MPVIATDFAASSEIWAIVSSNFNFNFVGSYKISSVVAIHVRAGSTSGHKSCECCSERVGRRIAGKL